MSIGVEPFFDEQTFTVTYVVSDPARKLCAVIDPVLDFDQASGRTYHESADKVVGFIKQNDFKLDII